MSTQATQFDLGILIRRSLFIVVLLSLTLGNVFTLFQGLNSPQAMDQAQIAREISRGNGFTTKMIRPVAYYQTEKAAERTIALVGFPDTYHSPLNPLINAAVFKLIGADKKDSWQMRENQLVYELDRVIAVICTVFFLLAIGVNYLLVSRIFDTKIAGVVAILMLFCEVFWTYSLSGLPQMLMLLLFSSGMYFAYRAVENTVEGRIAMAPAVIAGVFFTLLALTHWMTVWIALGYIIFAAFNFRPRGFVAISILALILLAAAGPIIRNMSITGTPLGTAFLTLFNGLGNGTEDVVMRNIDLEAEPLVLTGMFSKILRNTLLQASDIIPLLAGIVVAPLFFLSLLHPFQRPSIAIFRWAILLMWTTGAVGLAFFGISTNALDPNQIHLLFAPLMTAYGVAFVSILWSRLDFVTTVPQLRDVHHFVIIFICALPLILSLPDKVRIGMQVRDRGGLPHWPPYFAPALNSQVSGIKGWVDPKNVIFSDQPWAVAWYADRMSIWLPPTRDGFTKLEMIAADLQTPVAGILISPSSHGSGSIADVAGRYRDFTPMVIDGRVMQAVDQPGLALFDKGARIQDIAKRYIHRVPLFGYDMIFYSERPIIQQNSSGAR